MGLPLSWRLKYLEYERFYKYGIVCVGMENKRGQVAIFIILAIVIVSVILIFFLWVKPTYFDENTGNLGFEGCVKDVVEDGIFELERNAGFIAPGFSYTHMDRDFVYLCYTENYYDTCTVQVPFLKNVFDENLEASIRDEVNMCYENSLAELREQGYAVSAGDVEYNVEIEPGVVRVEIEAPTTVGGSGFARFNVRVNSPVYDMVMIATSLVQFETRYGDSDVSEMMLYYPNYYIEKLKQGDGTTLYSLKHRVFGDEFLFASRSLVFPAGYRG